MFIRSKSPGKIILHGEHAVVFGKTAIATSIDLTTAVEIRVEHDMNDICLNLHDFQFHISWGVNEFLRIKNDSFGEVNGIQLTTEFKQAIHPLIERVERVDAVDSVNAFLLLYFGLIGIYKKKVLPMTVDIKSQLPVGAGLGSSAAFSVSLTDALLAAFEVPNRNAELVSKLAYQIEKVFHGRPSGIDNSICTYGGAIQFRDGTITDRLACINDTSVILVYTSVKRNTKRLVQMTSERRQKYPSVINNIMDAIDSISLLAWENMKKMNDDNDEDGRDLIEMNQHLLNCIGAGHSSIDRIVQIANKYNLPAKLTGAGGGGTVVIYLTKGYQEHVIETLCKELDDENYKHWRVSLGAHGVQTSIESSPSVISFSDRT